MYLVQILLPLTDAQGRPQPGESFRLAGAELSERFGGLTAFTRAPAEGLWTGEGNKTTRDEIVIFEVMAEEIDRDWWRAYRQTLERRFRQEVVVIRAQAIELI